MAIVIVASASGAPGTTTLALGLALNWPRPVLLADADPGAHQAVLAGYFAGRSAHGKGLIRVAEAHRDRRSLREVIIDQTLPLTDDPGPSRLFLPGFAKPGSAALFAGVWPDLAECFARLADAGIDVIVDAGRLGAAGLPPALVDFAACVGLVTRSHLRAVTSARTYLAVLNEQVATSSSEARPGLVVIGPDQPYGSAEIGRALDAPVLATVADDPAAAAHLSDGRPRPRKFDHSPFAKSVQETAGRLSATLQRSAERIRI